MRLKSFQLATLAAGGCVTLGPKSGNGPLLGAGAADTGAGAGAGAATGAGRVAAGAGAGAGAAAGLGVSGVAATGAGAGALLAQPAPKAASTSKPLHSARRGWADDKDSMQRTIDFLRQFFGYAFDTCQFFNPGAGHAAQPAKTLQQT